MRVSIFANGLKQKRTRVTFKQVAVGRKPGIGALARGDRSPVQAGVDLTSRGQNKDECEFRVTRLKTAHVVHPQIFIKVAALY